MENVSSGVSQTTEERDLNKYSRMEIDVKERQKSANGLHGSIEEIRKSLQKGRKLKKEYLNVIFHEELNGGVVKRKRRGN